MDWGWGYNCRNWNRELRSVERYAFARTHEIRNFHGPIPPGRGEPHPGAGPGPGAGAVARPPGLRRGLDRRAPQRRLGDHLVSRDIHRRCRRPHQAHQARHRRHQHPVSPPVQYSEPHGAAGPHDPRQGDAGRGAGRAARRRLHVGHRRHGATAAHGRRLRHGTPPDDRDRADQLRERLVHAPGGDAAAAPLHQAPNAHRRRFGSVAIRRGPGRQVRGLGADHHRAARPGRPRLRPERAVGHLRDLRRRARPGGQPGRLAAGVAGTPGREQEGKR